MDNCPHQTVIVVKKAAVEQVLEQLQSRGIIYEFLPFDRPYHTPMFKPYADGWGRRFFSQLSISAPRVALYSCPATAEPVVTQIWTREQAFAGRHMPLAPDLTLALRDGGFVSIPPSDSALKPRPHPSGAHRPEGIFVAAGPGIRRGVSLPRQSILDVAPTLLYTLGLPVPEDFEGRVPAEMFEPSRLQDRPVSRGERTRPPQPFPERPAEAQDAEGEAEVLQRLRALGYVE
jgi:hypothetical protein